LIREVGLELNEAYFIRNVAMSTKLQVVATAVPGITLTNYSLGVFMVGQYSKDNEDLINRARANLRDLMIGKAFVFEEIEGTIVVNASFSKENEPKIRAIVKHLEGLLNTPTVSWHGQEH
jgi:hypothetical protein